jgi:hypothetical protein
MRIFQKTRQELFTFQKRQKVWRRFFDSAKRFELRITGDINRDNLCDGL